jgi:hypothetical protein
MIGFGSIAVLAVAAAIFLVLCVRQNRRPAFERRGPHRSILAEGIDWIEIAEASLSPVREAPAPAAPPPTLSAESDLLRLGRALGSSTPSAVVNNTDSNSAEKHPQQL